jgi:trans-aconitate methyltransferase
MQSDQSPLRQQIQKVYNKTVVPYNADRPRLRTHRYLRAFADLLPKHAFVLDLGCGSGDPVDIFLCKHGCAVTGIDFSGQQLQLARNACPNGQFLQRDLSTLQPNEFAVDGVVCLFTLFHLPRTEHAQWLKTIATYLPVGGPLLISMGDQDFEGWHPFHGEQVWSSHYGPKENRAMIEAAGFEIELDELLRSGDETHQMILAKKI